MYTILKPLAFCKYNGKSPEIGIALLGYFASTAWRKSDKAFNEILGRSFGWYSPDDDCMYKNDKSQFSRPTEDEIIHELWSNENFEKYAMENNLVSYQEQPNLVDIDQLANEYFENAYNFTEEDIVGSVGDR